MSHRGAAQGYRERIIHLNAGSEMRLGLENLEIHSLPFTWIGIHLGNWATRFRSRRRRRRQQEQQQQQG